MPATERKFMRVGLLLFINIGALVVALFGVSEWFIDRKARTTLLYEPNSQYRQDLLPNQTYTRDGFSYEIGAHGMRGLEPKMPKPMGLRIAVMGGSSVFDFRVKRSWPERTQDVLRASGIQAEVFNAGIPGFSTREMQPFYSKKVRPYAPDLVLFYGGWNDIKYMKAFVNKAEVRPYPVRPPNAPDPYAFLRAPRPFRNYYALQIFAQKMQIRAGFVAENTGAEAKVAAPVVQVETASVSWAKTAGMTYFKENLERFVQEVQNTGAEPMLVAEAVLFSPDLTAEDRERINYKLVGLKHDELIRVADTMAETMKAVAQDQGIVFLDPRPDMNGRPEYFIDHVHLSEAGSQALAEIVAAKLTEAIRTHSPSGVRFNR
jgi:lysophospholipase L1-like esterase